MRIYEVTEDSNDYYNQTASAEFPKIRKDLRKTKNGIPHVGLEYANGDMWYLPVAKDGNPVFTSSEIEWNDLLRRQLASKGVGFPLKYDGEYGKRAGQWMSQGDMWDYENEAQANSPLAKAEKENIAALKAAGVDWDKALADAEAGKVPDKRIQDADDLMGYLLQKNGIEDATPDRYQISGFGWDENDDGYTFKDTSWFVKKGTAGDNPDENPGDNTASDNPALDMLRQRQADRSNTSGDSGSSLGPTADPIIPNDDSGNIGDDNYDDDGPAMDPSRYNDKDGIDTATPDPKPEPEEPSRTLPDGSKISGVRNTTTKRTTTQRSGTDDLDDVEADVDAGFDAVDRVARQGQANVDRVAKQGRDNIDRIRKLAGLN